jgi:hypothetical protein
LDYLQKTLDTGWISTMDIMIMKCKKMES